MLLRCADVWPPADNDGGRPRHVDVAVLCGAGSALAGAVVFIVGWAGNVTVVRAPLPRPISMKAATAGMFVLCGTGVMLLQGDQMRKRLGRLCAVACLLIELAFLSEYVVGWNLGIDEFPFRDVVAHAAHIADPVGPAPRPCSVLV